MDYSIPESRREAVKAVLEALEGATSVVLTTHLNADGDGTGCQAALLDYLTQRDKEVWIVNPTPFPDQYRFLIDDPSRIISAGSETALRRCQAADLCVVVDTGEVTRIGRVNPLVDGVPKVIIDHHPTADRAIEGLSLRDDGAAAAGELVFDLLVEAGGPWTPAVVRGLYTAILTDTGSFRFANSTPGVHRVAAELIALGASPDELYRRIYGSHPLRRFRLLQRALDTLDTAHEGQVAWMVIPRSAYRELGCTPEDLEGMVDVPREVEGAEVALLFREMEDGAVKISFRSNGEADVNQLAREFDGGGHVRASGAVIQGEVAEVVQDVVQAAGGVLPGGGGTPEPGEPEGREARI